MSYLLTSPAHIILGAALILLVLFALEIRALYAKYDYLDGSPSSHWFFGNVRPYPGMEPGTVMRESFKKYGLTFRDRGFLSFPFFLTTDPRAISHVLNLGYRYPKPNFVIWIFQSITGLGVLVAEGDQHRRQRRIVAPSFALSQIRDLTPIFLQKSYELCKIIDLELVDNQVQELDMVRLVARCTFDVIGFGTELGCLDPGAGSSELADATRDIVEAQVETAGVMAVLQAKFPIFRILPTDRERRTKIARKVVQRLGKEIIAKKKAEVHSRSMDEKNIKKDDIGGGKDLLSLIIRATLADDVPESQKLSDEELLAQIVTFILAGFETSSTCITLTLEALCNDTDIQDKLRQEVSTLDDANPSLDSLNDLTYLDAVVRESLRRFPPGPGTLREAGQDDVIPLSVPVKNIKTGEMMREIPVKKGQQIFIPIINMNTNEEIWGPDGSEFKPERWLEALPESTNEAGSMWSHQATFLSGPRSCIGYRFALAEIKSILFVLIRTYRFEHISPKPNFYHRQAITMKPAIVGREEEGAMLPLKVARV
ncbi:cytochrome P450 [Mrakia frigida]|uniref:cytochrome P450 n=1 Tax=Mrakia frigida TaxID=29902 RepID=UPI003FCC0486